MMDTFEDDDFCSGCFDKAKHNRYCPECEQTYCESCKKCLACRCNIDLEYDDWRTYLELEKGLEISKY